MFRTTKARHAILATLCSALLAPATLFAGVPQSALLESVPDNVFLAIHAMDTPADDHIQAKWQGVMDSLHSSGIIQEAVQLLMSMNPEVGGMVQSQTDAAKQLFSAVEWKALTDREFLFSMRYDSHSLKITDAASGGKNVQVHPPEQLMIFRGSQAEKNFEAFKAILSYFETMAQGFAGVSEVTEGLPAGAKAVRFGPKEGGHESLLLALHGDMIAVGIFGDELLHDVLGKRGTALTSDTRFKAAFAALPTPETELVWFDMTRMADGMGGLFRSATEAAAPQIANDPNAAGMMALATKITERVLVEMKTMDYAAASGHVEGNQVYKVSLTAMNPDGTSSLGKMISSNQPIRAPFSMVPANAASFSINAGVDPQVVWDEVRGLVSEFAPNGDEMLAQGDAFLAQLPISLTGDILSWVHGSTMNVSLAGAPGQNNGVMMLAVKDEAVAKASVDKILSMLGGIMAQQGQQLTRTPSTLGEGFEKVFAPMMAMAMIQPVLGVKDGFLYFATNEGALKTVLDTRAGTNPNITTNDTFLSQVSQPKGAVQSASWTNLSNFGPELAMGLNMGAMMAGMPLAANPDVPAEVKKLVQMLPRVAQIVQKIDFMESKSSVIERDGNVWKTTQITTYKD